MESSSCPQFFITYTITNKYYPGEPVNIHVQQLINIIQENNRLITTKKRVRVNLPFFSGNRERVIPINTCTHCETSMEGTAR